MSVYLWILLGAILTVITVMICTAIVIGCWQGIRFATKKYFNVEIDTD